MAVRAHASVGISLLSRGDLSFMLLEPQASIYSETFASSSVDLHDKAARWVLEERFLGSLSAEIFWSIELEGCDWEVMVKLIVFPSELFTPFLPCFNDGNCEVNYKSQASLGC